MRDVWQAAAAYENYIGRWSRPIARAFVVGLSIPPEGVWIDVGCGSGALTDAILALGEPARVVALDRSVEFVAESRRSTDDFRVELVAGDAVRLPVRDKLAAAVVSGLVLNFVPQPELAVREMLRCARPAGTVATYVWDYADGMQFIRLFWDAAVSVDRTAVELDEARRFPLCQPAALVQLFSDAGATRVSTMSITVPTVFRDFEDLWDPFLGGQGPAPTYAASLPDEKRATLREQFRRLVPTNSDGTIELSAKAWVVRGVR
jgi:SAM-dependent methyltransferase